MRIEVSQDIAASPERVWEALSDLESHVGWMRDAREIVFRTDQRRGVGTTMEVETRVGPLRTNDVVKVTSWAEGEAIGVEHRGLVTGRGRLSVTPNGEGSLVTWVEDLTFPWWLGGPFTAWVAKPVLRAIWVGNLRRFRDGLNSP